LQDLAVLQPEPAGVPGTLHDPVLDLPLLERAAEVVAAARQRVDTASAPVEADLHALDLPRDGSPFLEFLIGDRRLPLPHARLERGLVDPDPVVVDEMPAEIGGERHEPTSRHGEQNTGTPPPLPPADERPGVETEAE